MSLYYGAIGNRDYIKLAGERRPFWDFLDRHPDGWLCSLAYKRRDVPETGRMIWDCGAWSYRLQDVPKLGPDEVTPQWATAQYRDYARPGDFVIAPDHMLIPGLGDLKARAAFNACSAAEFLPLAREAGFTPMAVVHGLTRDEKVQRAQVLAADGYTAIALGGLAGQASRRGMIIETVTAVRVAVPGVWLHVLGISAPSFVRVWEELGVQSFDGASHFKQAFTAGRFYMHRNGELLAFNAARPGQPVTAPLCACTACGLLREDDVDTRRYGSNETNMGRAAHNLNHLIAAIDWARRNVPTTPQAAFDWD